MTTATTDLRAPLTRYAARLHAAAGTEHHVASPLGAWLLLALAAPAATGAARDELADTLGMEPSAALAVAVELLEDPHPVVLSAAAAWLRAGAGTAATDAWLAGLPSRVDTGDVPDQAEIDAWAEEHTAGLIERFPLQVGPRTLLVLATALATRVSWEQPFLAAPAADLGDHGGWASRASEALRTPAGHGHRQFIAATERSGDAAVHVASATGGLAVVSVVAAPEVPAADLLADAYEVATAIVTGDPVRERSLFELPLAGGPAWTISERPAVTTAPDGREERCVAVLPAWSARSEHDLDRPELGFPAAASGLAGALGLDGLGYQALQAVVARYHRVGFEAAAVSAMAVRAGMPSTRDGVLRTAELRFGHPYAVVAVARDGRAGPHGRRPGRWHGLPIFSAWITTPS